MGIEPTPLPWSVLDQIRSDKSGFLRIEGPSGQKVCDIFPFAGNGGVGLDQARANAYAITKMYDASVQVRDALTQLVGWVEECGSDYEGREYCLMEARAALSNLRLLCQKSPQ